MPGLLCPPHNPTTTTITTATTPSSACPTTSSRHWASKGSTASPSAVLLPAWMQPHLPLYALWLQWPSVPTTASSPVPDAPHQPAQLLPPGPRWEPSEISVGAPSLDARGIIHPLQSTRVHTPGQHAFTRTRTWTWAWAWAWAWLLLPRTANLGAPGTPRLPVPTDHRKNGPGDGGRPEEAPRHFQPLPGGQSHEHVSPRKGRPKTGRRDCHTQVQRRDLVEASTLVTSQSFKVCLFNAILHHFWKLAHTGITTHLVLNN